MGQDPPAFDILAWNADSTRMPAAMHAFYLRNFYIENKLATGELEIGGTHHRPQHDQVADLRGVARSTTTSCPGASAYRSVGLVSGPARFVLGSGGHIAGHRRPARPQGLAQVADADQAGAPATAQAWQEAAERRPGSWWEDWATWSAEHSGPMREPAARRAAAATRCSATARALYVRT